MPRRDDIHTILILGSGPIVIGQGCEFDYSGTQACKALQEEGYRVVLVNSNPATIMTDPAFSDRTYIEPITADAVRRVIEKERERGTPIDALLPTIGGQTALNCACELEENGTLEDLDVRMIGASREIIHRAEDRHVFRGIVEELGLKMPKAKTVNTVEDGFEFLEEIGLPAILRPAFTLGGSGGGVAYNRAEFEDLLRRGLSASRINQVQIDESALGWKEYELEVVRDRNDNCVVVCGIENIDPMGVHTGDSITVAPILTLTDREYQVMRDAALDILRAVGVDTGGSNVQFAIDPQSGEMIVIEMNPRVSRSSALASKATGFPIARIAAKLAVGYTLDELRNDITGTTSACFEPSIDYVVTKMPRWTFEKFPEADETLTTQMKSVGEAMSIGRTFKESFQKAIRSMEVKRFGFGLDENDRWLKERRQQDGEQWPIDEETISRKLSVPCQGRMYYIRYALKAGWTADRIHELTGIDPWFIDQFAQLVEFEQELLAVDSLDALPVETFRAAKQMGYSDPQLACLYLGSIHTDTILQVRSRRKALGIEPVYKLVDTCAAEFEAITPYYYSTYEHPFEVDGELVRDDEIRVTDRKKIVILGGGPNRIGQGIEFDYCCCQASFACGEVGFESVMINSNPETVSTDYDTSDLLFFEPLTLEDTLNILERLNGGGIEIEGRTGEVLGCIVQFGGQTPLNLAHGLARAGVPIIGTGLDSIDAAEDRDRFKAILDELGLQQPESGIAYSMEEARGIAAKIGYPVLVRPSYVLGGRGMEICFDEEALARYMRNAVDVSELANAPVLIDRFLSEAIEVDIDVLADYRPHADTLCHQLEMSDEQPQAVICGIMEHIEEAGVHSGDSSCTIPTNTLSKAIVAQIEDNARQLAQRLSVRGLMNVQMAIKDDTIYVIEVNPRASRTVPFVAKAKGVPYARLAAKVMMGHSLASLEIKKRPETTFFAVKEPIFPFEKFPGVDVVLGPEMRSTGEVMGADRSLPIALAKAKMAVGQSLPIEGDVFISVRDSDKPGLIETARSLVSMGFTVHTTLGTHELLASHSIETSLIRKISEGARPNILDRLANGEIDLIINTPTRKGGETDEGRIRAMAVRCRVPMITTMTGARAAVQAIAALRAGSWSVSAMQDIYPDLARPATAPPEVPTPWLNTMSSGS
ncbi:MAG: carbamoyl phosphate synthase large subunit [Phycisphaerae bacterium]|nr:carbamoyl phosphate synthase large subunit [Phycisphaerae bacterium]|tara:strand:- start:688 stop:4167 length:3480 start_codon:yes stop_codon:yes gene_type:complete